MNVFMSMVEAVAEIEQLESMVSAQRSVIHGATLDSQQKQAEIERLKSQAEKLNRSRDKLKARLTKADTLIEYLTNGGK